jgi:hypothetical protein
MQSVGIDGELRVAAAADAGRISSRHQSKEAAAREPGYQFHIEPSSRRLTGSALAL